MNMKKILFILSLFLASVKVFSQTEPRLHPSQIGAYGAANLEILTSDGTVTVFRSIATLGLDPSSTNELQTLTSTSDATSHTVTLSNSGGSIQLVEGSGITLTTSGTGLNGIATIAATDNSTTNEIQTLGYTGTSSPVTLDISGSASDVTFVAGTNVTLSATGTALTINAASSTEVDGSVTNEGLLSVGAGGANTSTIVSNTSTSPAITIDGGVAATTGITITENTGTSTISIVAADVSATNELQTITRASLTVNTATLSNSGGTINLEDELTVEEFTPTAAATTVTTTAATPASENKIRIERNGVVQNVGASKGVSGITNEGNTATVITFTRAFSAGEMVRVIFPKQ